MSGGLCPEVVPGVSVDAIVLGRGELLKASLFLECEVRAARTQAGLEL